MPSAAEECRKPSGKCQGIIREFHIVWRVVTLNIAAGFACVRAGTVESNSQILEAACLTINFHKYNLKGPIYYPPFDKVSFSRLLVVFSALCANYTMAVNETVKLRPHHASHV